MTETLSVGRSELRKDAWAKVTGAARYVADIPLPGLMHAAILRSPHHHARILHVDTREALAMEGVAAVLTAEDVPGERIYGAILPDRPVLAW